MSIGLPEPYRMAFDSRFRHTCSIRMRSQKTDHGPGLLQSYLASAHCELRLEAADDIAHGRAEIDLVNAQIDSSTRQTRQVEQPIEHFGHSLQLMFQTTDLTEDPLGGDAL